AKVLWAAAALLLLVVTAQTAVVRPDLIGHAIHDPYCWLGLLLVVTAAVVLASGLATRREMLAFVGSNLLLVGLLAILAAPLFPAVLHSTLAPDYSLSPLPLAP